MKAWCFFEQSGTFKNEFKKFGFEAFDIDIQNEFNQTDYVLDIFKEIDLAFEGAEGTIFDKIDKDDVVLSFFPCIRFECQAQLWLSGNHASMKNWSELKKLQYVLKMHEELAAFYRTFTRMFIIAIRKGFRMVVENPCTAPHYLITYFPIRASMIDKNRASNGDYFKKPTQYWFVNFNPEANFLLEADEYQKMMVVDKNPKINGASVQTSRSMIHPNYARRFIYNNILTKEQAKEAIEFSNGWSE